MQFELDFAQPVGDVFAVDAAHVDGPLVCVVWVYAGGAVGGVEGFGDAAVDCGDGLALSRSGRRERGGNYRKDGRWRCPVLGGRVC